MDIAPLPPIPTWGRRSSAQSSLPPPSPAAAQEAPVLGSVGGASLGLLFPFLPTSWDAGTAYKIQDCSGQNRMYGHPAPEALWGHIICFSCDSIDSVAKVKGLDLSISKILQGASAITNTYRFCFFQRTQEIKLDAIQLPPHIFWLTSLGNPCRVHNNLTLKKQFQTTPSLVKNTKHPCHSFYKLSRYQYFDLQLLVNQLLLQGTSDQTVEFKQLLFFKLYTLKTWFWKFWGP